MADKQGRTNDRLREKYGGGQAKDEDAESETIQSENDSQVRDRSSFTMYLDDDDKHEIELLYLQLNKEYKAEYGETLEKNRLYYPAILQYGYTNPDDIRVELGLPVSKE